MAHRNKTPICKSFEINYHPSYQAAHHLVLQAADGGARVLVLLAGHEVRHARAVVEAQPLLQLRLVGVQRLQRRVLGRQLDLRAGK